ncbi:MAG: formate dehydrogenase subunit gamma [Thermoanaerobaculia bacterium]
MTAISGEHIEPAVLAARKRDNLIVDGEIIRHRAATRWIHWSVAFTFILSTVSGMPIWTPVFRWMAALVGGLEVARVIHPYAGVAFFLLSVVQFFHWLGDMNFSEDEKGSWGPSTLLRYMKWEEVTGNGKYNPGQKVFFWAVTLAAIGLLLSGIVMWFPLAFPLIIRELSILLHDITFICFLIAIILHIYLGTVAEPGTFRAMTRGTVTRGWAKLHHPGWFREITGGGTRKS